MGRPLRAAEGGMVYHVLNGANARDLFFEDERDYETFEQVIADALMRKPVRLLAYCLMPDHWQMLVWPRGGGDLSGFARWLTLTHTQRRHARYQTAGTGHIYRGRFKSFPVQSDGHFLTVCQYVERNARRAGLVRRAQDWRFGSLWHALHPDPDAPLKLSRWPVPRPADWVKRVNAPLTPAEEESVQRSIQRGQPFGGPVWQSRTTKRLGLESTFRPRGRPRKNPE